jgi:metal-responsive CopG/Arc/MetJ family transcriptional regulator
MSTMGRIAVTVPRRTLAALEQARRRTRRSRSSLVAEALDAWLARGTMNDADRAYVRGYLRVPERAEEAGAIAAAAVASWEPWDDAR